MSSADQKRVHQPNTLDRRISELAAGGWRLWNIPSVPVCGDPFHPFRREDDRLVPGFLGARKSRLNVSLDATLRIKAMGRLTSLSRGGQ